VLLGLPEGRNCLRCAPANSPCKPSSGSSKTGRNTRFHGPLAAKPGHTSIAPRRKGVGNSSNGRLRLTDVSAWVSTPRTVRTRPLPSSGMRPRMAISTCGQTLISVVADIWDCFFFGRKSPPTLKPLKRLPLPSLRARSSPLRNSPEQAGQGRLTICLTDLTLLRFVNRVGVLSGVKEFLRQLRSPKHIRYAL